MQGRQGQGGDPRERASRRPIASLNGTGQHRVPLRPPGIPRVNQPPPTPRIARPQREQQPPGKLRRRLLILGSVFVICAILAAIIGYVGFNYFGALSASSDAAATTTDFLTALSTSNYDQAYRDLGPTITLNTAPDDFKRRAQSDDLCYGPVKNFSLVPDSATAQDNSQSYTYNIVRSKSTKPYQLRLTLQQDKEGAGWKISDFGTDLGPGTPSPSCK
ncbi:MAG TPA: hypothetical protein VFB60_04255 [Ktedonobacteraceae bacterium]|nr:hypothetical protein [Ktedonobacteraceae bacterium]